MMSRSGGKNNSLKQPKEEVNVKYMHKPPTITPNYGNQKRTLLPKSKVSRVLLYDNATQEHMLDIKLAHINIEKERITRLLNLHKRSFSTRQTRRQQMMQQTSAANDKQHNSSKNTHSATNPDKNENKTQNMTHREKLPKKGLHVSQSERHNQSSPREKGQGTDMAEFKLPSIDHEQRHVIFKVEDAAGNTQVYHTIDQDGLIRDIIPVHTYYTKLTDDPRFKSLTKSLVPLI